MNKSINSLQLFPTKVNKNRLTKIDKNFKIIIFVLLNFLHKKNKKSHNINIRFILVERRVILDFLRFSIIRSKVFISSLFFVGLIKAGDESYNICM